MKQTFYNGHAHIDYSLWFEHRDRGIPWIDKPHPLWYLLHQFSLVHQDKERELISGLPVFTPLGSKLRKQFQQCRLRSGAA